MIRLNLGELAERLARLRAEEVMARALAAQAERMADAVRERLSDPPGAGGHDRPWRQTGALRDSVGAQADGLQAAVGSSDPAAAQPKTTPESRRTATFGASIQTALGPTMVRQAASPARAAQRGGAAKAGDE